MKQGDLTYLTFLEKLSEKYINRHSFDGLKISSTVDDNQLNQSISKQSSQNMNERCRSEMLYIRTALENITNFIEILITCNRNIFLLSCRSTTADIKLWNDSRIWYSFVSPQVKWYLILVQKNFDTNCLLNLFTPSSKYNVIEQKFLIQQVLNWTALFFMFC